MTALKPAGCTFALAVEVGFRTSFKLGVVKRPYPVCGLPLLKTASIPEKILRPKKPVKSRKERLFENQKNPEAADIYVCCPLCDAGGNTREGEDI